LGWFETSDEHARNDSSDVPREPRPAALAFELHKSRRRLWIVMNTDGADRHRAAAKQRPREAISH
jgi:hypothetical protein